MLYCASQLHLRKSGKERLQIRSCDGTLLGTEPSPGEWMDARALVW